MDSIIAIHPFKGQKGEIPIYRFQISLRGPVPFSVHWGSLMHGILIGLLPPPWPELLHGSDTRSLTQWIAPTEGCRATWHVHTMDDNLAECLIPVLQPGKRLYCRHVGQNIEITEVRAERVTLAELLDEAFSSEPGGLRLHLCTPTAHKSQGEYITLPTVELIGRSICRRLTAFAPDIMLADEEVLQAALDASRISRYALQSTTFQLEGSYVPAYQGWLEIHYHGDPEAKRIAHVLFLMAPLTGIGIKTTIGMGGCIAEPLTERKRG